MAGKARAKAKKPSRGAGKHPKKSAAAHHKKAPVHAKKTAPRAHAAPHKRPTQIKPPDVRFHRPQPILARKPLPRREFFVAASPAPGAMLPIKKKKKKPELVLRFTENTLKDIAALECVRRCFNS